MSTDFTARRRMSAKNAPQNTQKAKLIVYMAINFEKTLEEKGFNEVQYASCLYGFCMDEFYKVMQSPGHIYSKNSLERYEILWGESRE